MSTSTWQQMAGIVELVLVFGSVLGLLIWELYAVRRAQRGDEDRRNR